jgi:pimeloyl-ACP methyl ester carboxylesterase
LSVGRSPTENERPWDAQLAAITAWGIPHVSKLNRLAGIMHPTFVANGDNDEMMRTKNSYLLGEHLPDAHVRIYADANHGFLYQYPELFGDHVRVFLSG